MDVKEVSYRIEKYNSRLELINCFCKCVLIAVARRAANVERVSGRCVKETMERPLHEAYDHQRACSTCKSTLDGSKDHEITNFMFM